MTPAKIYFASSSQFRLWAEGQHWSQDKKKKRLQREASGCVPNHFSMAFLDLILVDTDFMI